LFFKERKGKDRNERKEGKERKERKEKERKGKEKLTQRMPPYMIEYTI
jgi:hypothetical protein